MTLETDEATCIKKIFAGLDDVVDGLNQLGFRREDPMYLKMANEALRFRKVIRNLVVMAASKRERRT